MEEKRKLYIVDDNTSFARVLKYALSGKVIKLPRTRRWILKEHMIEVLPHDETKSSKEIIEKLRKDKVGAVLVNVNLKLKDSDRRINRVGIRLSEATRVEFDTLKFPIVFFSLENLDRLLKDRECSRLLEDYSNMHTFIQLPFEISTLIQKIEESYQSFFIKASSSQREKLAQELLSEEMESMNSRFRHSFKDDGPVIAAVRVFLGALQEGDIDEETGRNVIKKLIQLDKKAGPESLEIYNWDLLYKYWSVKDEGETLPELGNSKKVLFIDDKCEESGWTECLRKILALQEIEVVAQSDPKEALKLLKQGGNEFGFVILDLFLEEDQSTGFEVLEEIKKEQLTLPVIAFTQLDDSVAAKACFERGAQGYFVKELKETKDRNSLKDYKKLKEVIKNTIKVASKPELTELWRRFVRIEGELEDWDREGIKKLSSILSIGGIAFPEDGIAECLRKAFYFLSFAFSGDCRTKELLGGESSLARECIVYAVSALHRMLIYRLGNDRKIGIDDMIESCIRYDHLDESFEDYKGHWSHTGGWRHYFLRPSEKERIEKKPLKSSIDCLNHVLSFAEECLNNVLGKISPSKSSAQLPSFTFDRPESLLDEALERQTMVDQHSAIQRKGAGDLRVGSYLYRLSRGNNQNNQDKYKELGEKYKEYDASNAQEFNQWLKKELEKLPSPKFGDECQVVFIDDNPEEGSFQDSLEYVFNDLNYEVQLKIYDEDKIVEGINLREFPEVDLILLDLYIPNPDDNNPSAEYGLELLKKIKEELFAVPVVTLTASNEARQVFRCFERGAMNYFVKGYPNYSLEAVKRHYKEFRSILKSALEKGRNSPERNIWKSLQDFEKSGRLPRFTKERYKQPVRKDWYLEENESISNQIHFAVCSILKKAYYWLTIDQQRFQEYNTRRLLFLGKKKEEMPKYTIRSVLWYFGMAIEIYLKLWTLLESGPPLLGTSAGTILHDNAEKLKTKYRKLKETAEEIWEQRVSVLFESDTQTLTKEECEYYFQNTISFLKEMNERFRGQL